MTDRRPPDDEDFGAGSGGAGTEPDVAPPPPDHEETRLAEDLETAGPSLDEHLAAVTDFMDDLIEVDLPSDADVHDPMTDLPGD